MGLERRFIEQDTVLDKVKFVAAADETPVNVTMAVSDYVVRAANAINAAAAGGDVTLTLPPVAEAAGRFYSVLATAVENLGVGASGAIIVASRGDDSFFEGPYVLTAAGDRVVLYSDGFSWHEMASTLTP